MSMATIEMETRDETMDALFGAELDTLAEELAKTDPVKYTYDPALAPVASSVPCGVTLTLLLMC